MHRVIILLFWSLLFGIFAALAAAWLPAVFSTRGATASGWATIDGRTWSVVMTRQTFGDHIHLRQGGFAPLGGPPKQLQSDMAEALNFDLPSREESPYLRSFEIVRAGWPWRSFRATRQFDLTTIDPLAELWTHGAILEERSLLEPLSMRVLPYGPIWSGLLANVAVWSTMWGALFLGFGSLRGFRRRRSGRCVQCGYDLAHTTSGTCPECGAMITPAT